MMEWEGDGGIWKRKATWTLVDLPYYSPPPAGGLSCKLVVATTVCIDPRNLFFPRLPVLLSSMGHSPIFGPARCKMEVL
jgi:hypothetical protein